jgi:hypothetical protein
MNKLPASSKISISSHQTDFNGSIAYQSAGIGPIGVNSSIASGS